MSDIRIHKPVPGLHSWGIEFNYSPEDRISTDADANDFVHAVNTIRQKCLFFCGSISVVPLLKTMYRDSEATNSLNIGGRTEN